MPQYRTQTWDDYATPPPPKCTNTLTTACFLATNYASCLAETGTSTAGLSIGESTTAYIAPRVCTFQSAC